MDSVELSPTNYYPYSSTQLNDLFCALAKSQSEMGFAGKSAANPFFKSNYAPLIELVRASRPALTKHGLSVTQLILSNDKDIPYLHTRLCHASGQWIESRIKISPSKPDIQALGSYITYLKRYAYAAIVGVIDCDEDDDGEMIMQHERQNNSQSFHNPKITLEQFEELEHELSGYPHIAKQVIDGLKITNLTEMKKSDFLRSINRIRQLKQG